MTKLSTTTLALILTHDISKDLTGLSHDMTAISRPFGREPWVCEIIKEEGAAKVLETIGDIDQKYAVDGIQVAQTFMFVGSSLTRGAALMGRLNRQVPVNSMAHKAFEQSASKVEAIIAKNPVYASAFAPVRQVLAKINSKVQASEPVTLGDVRAFYISLSFAFNNAAGMIEKQYVGNNDEGYAAAN
jgi:hypothetical protein